MLSLIVAVVVLLAYVIGLPVLSIRFLLRYRGKDTEEHIDKSFRQKYSTLYLDFYDDKRAFLLARIARSVWHFFLFVATH